jgi:hypothetical protein
MLVSRCVLSAFGKIEKGLGSTTADAARAGSLPHVDHTCPFVSLSQECISS